jgi:hypothetical protein
MAIGNQPKQNLFTAEARRRGEKQDGSPQIYAEKRRWIRAVGKTKSGDLTAKDAEGAKEEERKTGAPQIYAKKRREAEQLAISN